MAKRFQAPPPRIVWQSDNGTARVIRYAFNDYGLEINGQSCGGFTTSAEAEHEALVILSQEAHELEIALADEGVLYGLAVA